MCCAILHRDAAARSAARPPIGRGPADRHRRPAVAIERAAVSPARPVKVMIRVLVALALLVLAGWAAGFEALAARLRQVDPLWFAVAALVMAASQWMSAARWVSIARILGLNAPAAALRLAYAQGMAVNVVLPGAVLGGDALRSVRLQRLGNPLPESALSVLLDRLSGLWILCVLSLATALPLLLALRTGGAAGVPGWPVIAAPGSAAGPALGSVLAPVVGLYFAGLAFAVVLPFLPWPMHRAAQAGAARDTAVRRALARLAELHALTLQRRRPLARSLWTSVLVQLLCSLTLWLCLLAAGGHAEYWRVQAVAAPVFIAGVMPLSYGGFGARELVALAVFPLVGVEPQLGVAAAALYGVCAVCLGLAASPLLALRNPPAAAAS
jgi:uncharacterized membrane protein YbhN (UPF0104 family)